MPQERNLFNKDGNFNHNLIFKLFPLSNADNEDEQHSILFQDEDAPKDSFQLLDDNDIADAKYNATEMVPEENSDDHMQINEEAIPKIFDITKSENLSEDLSASILKTPKKRKREIFTIEKEKEANEIFHYKQANYLIRWITSINQYSIKTINDKIKQNPSLQDIILHTPSYDSFSEKIIIKENQKEFLNKTMKDILQEKEIKNRKDNSSFIKRIEETNDEELISLLNMNYKNVIKKFYDSFDFELFKYNR